jgi:hypothetical protein
LARVNELVAKSPDVKKIVNNIKESCAHIWKSIIVGKQERYTKVMALLYTREKDGSVIFHAPYQSVIDFK